VLNKLLPQKLRLLRKKYKWFLDDLSKYKKQLNENDANENIELFPQLHDKTVNTGFDTHYTYQGPWVFEKLIINKPKRHIDIGSSVMYMGFFAAIVPTEFIDIRPTGLEYKNFTEKKGSILKLPYRTASLDSVSCLHVVEHIGLGRYGDTVDARGSEKACREMARTVKVGGNLYLSTPVGKQITYFNAHRVFNPETIINYFPNFKLVEFSMVNDRGKKTLNTNPSNAIRQKYALGLFWLKRVK
jgi:SAM-dependent methyltransferase